MDQLSRVSQLFNPGKLPGLFPGRVNGTWIDYKISGGDWGRILDAWPRLDGQPAVLSQFVVLVLHALGCKIVGAPTLAEAEEAEMSLRGDGRTSFVIDTLEPIGSVCGLLAQQGFIWVAAVKPPGHGPPFRAHYVQPTADKS